MGQCTVVRLAYVYCFLYTIAYGCSSPKWPLCADVLLKTYSLIAAFLCFSRVKLSCPVLFILSQSAVTTVLFGVLTTFLGVTNFFLLFIVSVIIKLVCCIYLHSMYFLMCFYTVSQKSSHL